jgi:hypothetical protein
MTRSRYRGNLEIRTQSFWSYADRRNEGSVADRSGTERCDVLVSSCNWSMIGSARCLGKHVIRSQLHQHSSTNGTIGENKSAAFCHSIAAVKGNPFLSSRCAAWQYLNARAEVSANESILGNFHAGRTSTSLTNLDSRFIPLTSHLGEHSYNLAVAVALITRSGVLWL